MAILEVTQNDFREGKKVNAPVAIAQISVRDVTVMADPACFIVRPIDFMSPFIFFSSSVMLLKHFMMTNISSIPIARHRNETVPDRMV